MVTFSIFNDAANIENKLIDNPPKRHVALKILMTYLVLLMIVHDVGNGILIILHDIGINRFICILHIFKE